MNLYKATNEQLMNILRHDHSIPNDLLKTILEEAINRQLLRGYVLDNINKYFTDIKLIERKYNVTIDDLLQIGYMALLKAADTFREGKAGFTTWFVLPIRGAMRQFIRDNNMQKRVADVISIETPLHEEFTIEQILPSTVNVEKHVVSKISVEEILNTLNDKQKEIVTLRLQGYQFIEIAKMVKHSKQYTHKLYSKAIEELGERVS